MLLDEREVVQRAMQALGVKTVFIYHPDSDREVAYEDGEPVEITTEGEYASCTPNDDGSWDCTRYTMKVELEPAFEAKSSQEAVEQCVKEFGVDRVLVIGKDSWRWYENGEWMETSLGNVIAAAQESEVPFATCQQHESEQWLVFLPGGEPDEEGETVTLS